MERDSGGCARRVEFAVRTLDEGVDKVPTLDDADALRGGEVGLDFVGVGCVRGAELQRGEAVAMFSDVDGFGRTVEGLTDVEDGLAVRVPGAGDEGDLGSEGDVARDFRPGEVEVVAAGPHVLPVARDGVGAGGAVELRSSGMFHLADVLVGVEDAEPFLAGMLDRAGLLGVERGEQGRGAEKGAEDGT